MKEIIIENFTFYVEDNEFNVKYIEEYCNLIMYEDLGDLEVLTGLVNDLCIDLKLKKILVINPTHGGYIPYILSNNHNVSVLFYEDYVNHKNNFFKNIENYKNINIVNEFKNEYDIVFSDKHLHFIKDFDLNFFLISSIDMFIYNNRYKLKELSYKLYVPDIYYISFFDNFYYYIEDNIFNYDNLINLCIMVKNAGDQFRDVLLKNLNIIDKWTVLDTGSNDNTIAIIHEVLSCKKGKLYQEPFINFRDSRNRLLDLAGTSCKYTIMIDDTYIMRGDIREFLKITRSDQFSDSFALFIKSYDVEYASNRILKTNRNLRYLYKIHEVIDPNNNKQIIVPIGKAYIDDNNNSYMHKRTYDRKILDLKLLIEELQDDPKNPRTYYYLAQTYNGLDNYELSYYWFNERVNHENEGFIHEKVDAAFERARLANFKLNKEWDICEKLYKEAYELDKTRPESPYFIGIHYYNENNINLAYHYFKQAFEIGYPTHTQYSLKPTLSFYYLPKFLTFICYEMNDYILGEKSALLFLQKNDKKDEDYQKIFDWYLIYKNLNKYTKTPFITNIPSEKPIFCFLADGNFNKWSGSSINNIGVGGSETYIIEMARYIQKNGIFQVYVFCKCDEVEYFEDVIYTPIEQYHEFINSTKVHTCIISRYPEYLPVTYKSFCENVFLVLHDIAHSGIIILDKKLKNILCLSEWHVEQFTNIYPMLKSITIAFHYGINIPDNSCEKIPYKFIYSSFPNRGLLPLLEMWPTIYEMQPLSSLHIYSDINGEWVNSVDGDMMKKIKTILSEISHMNIFYHGWVDKKTLLESWKTADLWFYPCIFKETFCLTALEAAINKTLVITNDLAALKTTVNDRGIIIPGTVDDEWKKKAIYQISIYFNDRENELYKILINKNYLWASKLRWEDRSKLLEEYIINYYTGSLEEYKSYKQFKLKTDKYIIENIKKFYLSNENKKIKILQIGNGILPITIFLNNFPNSKASIIYDWEYDNNNIKNEYDNSSYKELIKIVQGCTISILKSMLIESSIYNFIYLNIINYNNYELYLILFICYNLLEEQGVIFIDNMKDNNLPLSIVEFLKKYKNIKYERNKDILFLTKTL